MDSSGANAPASGAFADFFRVGSNPGGGFFLAQVPTYRMIPRVTDLTHGPGSSTSSNEEVGDCWYTTELTCSRDTTPANGCF